MVDWEKAGEVVAGAFEQALEIATDWPEKWYASVNEEDFPPRLEIEFALVEFDQRRAFATGIANPKYPEVPTVWANPLRDEELIELGDLIADLADTLGFRPFKPKNTNGWIMYQLRPHYE